MKLKKEHRCIYRERYEAALNVLVDELEMMRITKLDAVAWIDREMETMRLEAAGNKTRNLSQ